MPPQTNPSMSTQDILVIIGAISAFFATVLLPGVLAIVRAFRRQDVILQDQNVTLDKIHRLTNSNHTTSLQLVADSALKTAQTTGELEDVKLYESAHKALFRAETATKKLEAADDSKKSE